jgi:glutamyl-tRNA synthetase
MESFRWLGIPFNEGVGIGGAYGPYRQSERKSLYKRYVDELLSSGHAYIAFDTPAELASIRKTASNFQYDAVVRMRMRNSLTMSASEVNARMSDGEPYVVRIKIDPGEEIHVNDLIRGEVVFRSSILDDKVLYKSVDGLPTYHMANVTDDYLMKITHVIRGEEWLSSSPLHVLLYRYLGWSSSMPEFAHLPLILKPEGGGKLSKRDGDRLGFPVFPLEWRDPVSGELSRGYRESGYLPEAVLNFLALLGWNPGDDRELMSMDELIRDFDLTRCNKSGAKFDYEKAKWFNHRYIGIKSDAEIASMFTPYLESHGVRAEPPYIKKVVGLMKDRVSFIPELWDQTYYFFVAPEGYDEKTRARRWKPESGVQLAELMVVLDKCDPFDAGYTEGVVREWISSKGYSLGEIMNALRLALVGAGIGPQVFAITELIGKGETLRRIGRAIEVMG